MLINGNKQNDKIKGCGVLDVKREMYFDFGEAMNEET